MNEEDMKFKWVKWYDPFGRDIDKTDEWPEIQRQFKEKNMEMFVDESMQFDHNDIQHPVDPKNRPLQIVQTPMGIIPLTENTIPSKVFNFWIAHTNFTITKNFETVMNRVEGVEVLRVLSRYRVQVGIGKLFEEVDTCKRIQEAVRDANRKTVARRTKIDS